MLPCEVVAQHFRKSKENMWTYANKASGLPHQFCPSSLLHPHILSVNIMTAPHLLLWSSKAKLFYFLGFLTAATSLFFCKRMSAEGSYVVHFSAIKCHDFMLENHYQEGTRDDSVRAPREGTPCPCS